MEKFGAYKILKDKKLIVEYYSGDLTVKDLIFFKDVISKDQNYNLYWNTIADFRDSTVLAKNDELIQIVDFLKSKFKESEESGVRTIAYLSSKPNEVALSVLYSLLVKNSGLNYNNIIASSIDVIIKNFDDNVITENEVVEIIDELKVQSNNLFD